VRRGGDGVVCAFFSLPFSLFGRVLVLFPRSRISATNVANIDLAVVKYTVTGLIPYTNYKFRVTAHNAVDGGSFGPASPESALFQTLESGQTDDFIVSSTV
jgi:hypothetical protein